MPETPQEYDLRQTLHWLESAERRIKATKKAIKTHNPEETDHNLYHANGLLFIAQAKVIEYFSKYKEDQNNEKTTSL